MRPALILTLLCCSLGGVALAQQPAPSNVPPPPPAGVAPPSPSDTAAPAPASSLPANPATPETAPVEPQGARETPLDTEPFDARVHRLLDEYNQRHEQRQVEMESYDKVGGSNPDLERFADPRKVQVELKDELDREQTSDELANTYAEQAREVQSKERALQDFIAKRHKALDDLSQPNGTVNRQDLEVALANLARQPETPEGLAQMREIDRRLLEAERNEKELPAQRSRTQQEAAGAAEELAKLKGLEQFWDKESKAFEADALSARQNRLGLANRLEYYVVRAQAEDELELGRNMTESVHHIPASPEVGNTLNTPAATVRSDADLEQLRRCIQQTGDVRGCYQKGR